MNTRYINDVRGRITLVDDSQGPDRQWSVSREVPDDSSSELRYRYCNGLFNLPQDWTDEQIRIAVWIWEQGFKRGDGSGRHDMARELRCLLQIRP